MFRNSFVARCHVTSKTLHVICVRYYSVCTCVGVERECERECALGSCMEAHVSATRQNRILLLETMFLVWQNWGTLAKQMFLEACFPVSPVQDLSDRPNHKPRPSTARVRTGNELRPSRQVTLEALFT